MDRVTTQFSIKTAERDLASVRGTLLIVAQTGDADDLSTARRDLARLESEARDHGHHGIADAAAEAFGALGQIGTTGASNGALKTLDLLALIEANVWRLAKHELIDDVAGFVESSFDDITSAADSDIERLRDDFDIDEETLDIFRTEADELLANIFNELEKLAASPADTNALWNIRRNAHTFKGAAGIVGLNEASSTAHRMEDLLDKMVELRIEASRDILEFLDASAMHLNSLVTAKNLNNDPQLGKHYEAAIASLTPSTATDDPDTGKAASLDDRPQSTRPVAAPIVRVALDRLDELLTVSRKLADSRTGLAERFHAVPFSGIDEEIRTRLAAMLDEQRRLTDELHEKIQQIRMVRFANLETRLSRAVQVTSVDEGKKVEVAMENGETEIDTQIVDALVEPLLHLLKNAVVHGIERPETRRLLGKDETGSIVIRLEADGEAVVVTVTDDGSGIHISKIKAKAIANGILSSDAADVISDRDALELIFDRGLTTADKIDINAGRGVGMSIVRESIESRGGTVHVETEPQKGTTFTLYVPVYQTSPIKQQAEPQVKTSIDANEAPPLVLIVDDSPSIRRQTQKIVATAGFKTITANSGADALELLLNGTIEPDLILSDVEMPQIDGWEMLEYVKTDENFGHIPVVLVTSLDSEEHQMRAAELGASGYVIKPFSENDLANVVESLGIGAPT